MIVTTAYISLGGNMGGEEALFADALRRIASWNEVDVIKVSSLYRTEPQGDLNQNWFQNQVAELACENISPTALLKALQVLETEMGRERDPARRFGPRRIDLDLLLFGCIVSRGECLTLPHPRMTMRAFVLVPLLEIAPKVALPNDVPLRSYLEKLDHHVIGNAIYQK